MKYKIYTVNSCADSDETLVILGNPANKDGTPSSILKSRLDAALYYFREHSVRNIIVTGRANYNEFEESEVQKQYLINHGIPQNIIIKENKSTSTPDNALYTYRIAKELDLKNIVVITSHYHKKRSQYIFNHYFSSYKIVTPYPSIFYVIKNIVYYLWDKYCLFKTRQKDERLERR